MNVLLIRLSAPLMSFGGPVVDNHGVVQSFPAASMLTGLLGNALGYHHGDGEALNRLQTRLRFATRLDRPGEPVMDYQTVDLGQDFLIGTGWTTWGRAEVRAGGSAREATHIRYRHFRADAVCTVALTLVPADESPTTDDLDVALTSPSRPLYIGRKSCIPSIPLRLDRREEKTLLDALLRTPAIHGNTRVMAQWPIEEQGPSSVTVPVVDERDWVNQVHCGERRVRQGEIEIEESR